MAKDLLETDEGRAWVSIDATQRAAREWEHRLVASRRELLVKCRNSSDPSVRGAYEQLMVLESITKYLNGG